MTGSTENPSEADTDGVKAQFLSELLFARSGELADAAADRVLRRHPELASRYHPVPKAKWREHMLGRVTDLASAISAGRREIFAAQLAWAKTAFAARGVPVRDLAVGLAALHDTLESEVPPEDAALLGEYIRDAAAELTRPAEAAPPRLTTDTPHGRVAATYLLAILEGDRLAAGRCVQDAVRGGLSVRDAYTQVLMPVQQELGRMWHLGEITVAEEHFATATTAAVMSQLLPMAPTKPRDGRTVLAASVRGNAHDLGVRMFADMLEMDGWRTIYLGANVPEDDLVAAAMDFAVDLVALSATLPVQIRPLEETIRLLRTSLAPPGPRVIVGGLAFAASPGLWQHLGADAQAADADEGVRVADRLVPKPRVPRSDPRG